MENTKFELFEEATQGREVDSEILEAQLRHCLSFLHPDKVEMFCMYHGVLGYPKARQEDIAEVFEMNRAMVSRIAEAVDKRVIQIMDGIYNNGSQNNPKTV